VKIILHMGQAKTGTSSLQQALQAAAPALRARGVLYPDLEPGSVAHKLLLALCGDVNRLPRWQLEQMGGPEGARDIARRGWARMCDDIRDTRPELLVLSSEYLVVHTDGRQKADLAALLSPLSAEITPVIYVRHPVEHYRSRLQQSLRHSDERCLPVGLNLKRAVLDTEAAFGRAPELVAFDRTVLHGADIVRDFATRFLSPLVGPEDLPAVTANVGLSAEATALLARLRAEAGGTYEASRKVAKLLRLMEVLDREDPPAQPFTLLPEVAEAALRSASCHRWLAETGRLQIPGLQTDRIDGSPPPDWMHEAAPDSLFLHDPDRLDRLRQAVERHRAKGKASGPGNRQAKRPAFRLRKWLLQGLQRKLNALQSRYPGPWLPR
jgi:hypothetical protein